MAFNGTWMKCGNCTFSNPSFKKDGFKFAPVLVQVTDAGQTASGKLQIKVLDHIRRKIWCSFPPMTPEQFKVYHDVLHLNETGPSMYLEIEAYDMVNDEWTTDTYYHTDIVWHPVHVGGQWLIQVDDFELIGH